MTDDIMVIYNYTAKTEGLKQPRLGFFSCSHKFC